MKMLKPSPYKDMEGLRIYEKDTLSMSFGIPPTQAMFEVFYSEPLKKWMVECTNGKTPKYCELKDIDLRSTRVT